MTMLKKQCKTSKLTWERLTELLHYSPDTGKFYWIKARRGVRAGSIAGTTSKNDGYVRIVIDGVQHLASRLAWIYVTKEFPTQEIDHINRVRNDNRFFNLRDVSSELNSWNSSQQVGETVGVYRTKAGLYRARWKDTQLYLGKDFFEAICRRKSAEARYVSK